MTVTKGYAMMRAHTAPRQKKRKTLAPGLNATQLHAL
jgi:hypothetical protein